MNTQGNKKSKFQRYALRKRFTTHRKERKKETTTTKTLHFLQLPICRMGLSENEVAASAYVWVLELT